MKNKCSLQKESMLCDIFELDERTQKIIKKELEAHGLQCIGYGVDQGKSIVECALHQGMSRKEVELMLLKVNRLLK